MQYFYWKKGVGSNCGTRSVIDNQIKLFWLSYISQLPPFFKQESQSEVSLAAQSLVLWVSAGQCSAQSDNDWHL